MHLVNKMAKQQFVIIKLNLMYGKLAVKFEAKKYLPTGNNVTPCFLFWKTCLEKQPVELDIQYNLLNAEERKKMK